jgi:hypothetical protein
VENALDVDGLEILESPLSPQRLFELFHGEEKDA